MTEDTLPPPEPKTPANSSQAAFAAGLPIGIGVGIALGAAVGVAMGNIALGIGVGVAIGVALAPAFGAGIAKQQKKDGAAANEPSGDER